ncbi:MAG: hypothetical protein HXY24_04445 [Rubrivivax sp.]|nr:hypothetical protein [Rubrivivax sp.]
MSTELMKRSRRPSGVGAMSIDRLAGSGDDRSSEICQPGKQLVAWIVPGTPARASHPKSGERPEMVPTD